MLRKIILFTIWVLLLISCSARERAVEWIKTAEKPIIVKTYGYSSWGHTYYTLIDANGDIYNTGAVTMALPDTIKNNLNNK